VLADGLSKMEKVNNELKGPTPDTKHYFPEGTGKDQEKPQSE
jgi:hypothetical protein